MTLDELGFAIAANVLAEAEIDGLIAMAAEFPARARGGARNLLDVAAIRALADSSKLRRLVEPVLGVACFPVRALYFDKTPEANWKVPWHQDLAIAVQARVDGARDYGAWSVKQGVPHVEPPVEVLERMLAVRLHLDDCGADNGPLRVIEGSHRLGRLRENRIEAARAAGREMLCTVARGGAVLMRPLLLHASSPAASPMHRRVIHIEYAAGELPGGVGWHVRAGN